MAQLSGAGGDPTIKNFNAGNSNEISHTNGTGTLIFAANAARKNATLQNQGTIDLYISNDPAVSSTGTKRGFLLSGGLTPAAVLSDSTKKSAIYAVAAATGSSLYAEETA